MSKKLDKLKEKSFSDLMNYCQQTIGEVITFYGYNSKNRVVYSVYDKEFEEIAIIGKVKFIQKFDNFYASVGKDYVSEVVENPTWLQLAVMANEMIDTINDYHHIYFEGFRKVETVNDVAICHFIMGS